MKYVPFSNTNMYLPDPLPEQVRFGYYLPGAEQPAEILLEDSWAVYKGYYFFLFNPVVSSDTNALAELQKKLAAEPLLQHPLHTGACWWMNKGGSSTVQSVLQTDVADGNVIIYSHTNLGFGAYQLPLFQGAPLAFQPGGILCSGYPAVEGAQPASAAKGISIAVAGDEAGILTGQAMINDFSDNEYTGWSAGFRYNMRLNSYASQYYPLFNNNASTYWVFDLHWDPLHPLDSSRSYLAFTGIHFGLEKEDGTQDRFRIIPGNAPMQSWLRTIYGLPVSLQPVTDGANPAQLVFQSYANPLGTPAYYMAPKGTFILQAAPDSEGFCQLLPGLSGTESIRFRPGDEIIFYPGNAAYAGSGLSGNELDNSFTASWAFIKAVSADPEKAIIYSAAPETASLYQPSGKAGLLGSYYAATAQLPAVPIDTYCFPLVPYAGLNRQQNNAFTPDQVATFESRLLVTNREKRMASMPVPEKTALTSGAITTTTRQGLLAKIDGLQWNEVLLAKNTELAADFRFTSLPAELRRAFQSENLFLVVSDAAHLGAFDNQLSIEGWQFNVEVPLRDPQEDPEQKNILLLKFRRGAITDLILNTTLWTDPHTFNYDQEQLLSTQTWLMNYCNEAIEMAADNPQFSHFASIVQDPDWYGILALRTDIDAGNFPRDLRGLLGAMDLARFYAHHVGVQVNFVDGTTGDLEVKGSNLFALISYIDPAYRQSQHETTAGKQAAMAYTVVQNSVADIAYAYKVLILQVVFANSTLTNFDSKLELTARKWFDDPGTLNVPDSRDNPANYSMIFNGSYENHDGHRTYTFLTRQELPYRYFLTSKVLYYIEFVKAQFQTTASVPSGTEGVERITARFTFYGFLNFNKQKNFDCFSYGAEEGQELQNGRGLYFSNLALDVAFLLNTVANTTTNLTIRLNPGNVSFDQSMSTMREKSFAASFPISPNVILNGVDDNTPKKIGYLQVTPPSDFETAGLQPVWYAINFNLHWGGPGALASQAGFMPQLMLAWSPGADSVNAGLFIRLPGAGGGNTFSIQNVLQLSAGPFQLKQVAHGEDKLSYNFFLLNLSLSLFGVRLPPVGNTNLVLIGDAEQPGTLGWYGAYINLNESS